MDAKAAKKRISESVSIENRNLSRLNGHCSSQHGIVWFSGSSNKVTINSDATENGKTKTPGAYSNVEINISHSGLLIS